MIRTIASLVACSALIAFGAIACAELNCHGGVACTGASTDDGGGINGPDALPASGCDVRADVKDAPRCVTDDLGVFVDVAHGSDESVGSKASPVASVAAALTRLGDKRRIYLCEGTFDEHVALSAPVSLFGGFACGTWDYTGVKATFAPKTKGYALLVTGAADASKSDSLVFADLVLRAADAIDPGESSVAVSVRSAANVTFRRADLRAGKAASGRDAVDPAPFSPVNAPDGAPGAAPASGLQTINPACPTSVGGAGGRNGDINGKNGEVKVDPPSPLSSTGMGGTGGATCAAGGGGDGSYGGEGAGGFGAATLGTLDASGWKGQGGISGVSGGNGQGGGGGAQRAKDGVGGSGGPGGCGGAGGLDGTAAGASIALLIFQANVELQLTTLAASEPGNGGNAAKGQKAQLRSLTPAPASNGAKACAGGIGGLGGSGGGGGGSAGGLSVGILYKGAAPTLDGVVTAAADTLPFVSLAPQGGRAGKHGAGGDAADPEDPASRPGKPGTDGASGQARAIMSAP